MGSHRRQPNIGCGSKLASADASIGQQRPAVRMEDPNRAGKALSAPKDGATLLLDEGSLC